MKIEDLLQRVTKRTKLYFTDYVSSGSGVTVRPVDLTAVLSDIPPEDQDDPDVVGFEFDALHPDPSRVYLTNDWSRSQFLTFLGVREKWFSTVDLHTQAEEINKRMAMLVEHRFLTMRPIDSSITRAGILRGFVSLHFQQILDQTVVERVAEIMPGSTVTRALSGMSDSMLYATVVNTDVQLSFNIGGAPTSVQPCFIVSNSEIGAASLKIRPGLVWGGSVLWSSRGLFKKIHRGREAKILESLEDALRRAQKSWGGWADQASQLSKLRWNNEAEVFEAMTPVFERYGTKKLNREFTSAYMKHSGPHDGLRVATAVADIVQVQGDLDATAARSRVAGLIIIEFLFKHI